MTPEISRENLDRIGADAIRTVLAAQFKLSAAPAPAGKAAHCGPDENSLGVSVDLHGSHRQGRVSLRLPLPWIESLNASIGNASPDPAAKDGELSDLAGELCNMIAGRIGAGLAAAGHSFGLGTPSVLRGRPPQIEPGPDVIFSQTDWTCAGETLTLMVSIE